MKMVSRKICFCDIFNYFYIFIIYTLILKYFVHRRRLPDDVRSCRNYAYLQEIYDAVRATDSKYNQIIKCQGTQWLLIDLFLDINNRNQFILSAEFSCLATRFTIHYRAKFSRVFSTYIPTIQNILRFSYERRKAGVVQLTLRRGVTSWS